MGSGTALAPSGAQEALATCGRFGGLRYGSLGILLLPAYKETMSVGLGFSDSSHFTITGRVRVAGCMPLVFSATAVVYLALIPRWKSAGVSMWSCSTKLTRHDALALLPG